VDPELSFVAISEGEEAIGHVVCTRAHVDTIPVLALGPLSVHPDHQRRGVGLALVHSVLGAADAAGEPLVCLLGSPDYYRRFGFRPSGQLGIVPPDPAWAEFFQARILAAYDPAVRGAFAYAEPFNHL
jgi:putative acetyltransferase